MRAPSLHSYPTDLSDAEWAALEPLLPLPAGQRRSTTVARHHAPRL